MSFQGHGTDISRTAGADLSAKQFHWVKESAGGLVSCGAGDDPLGVLQNNPGNGEAATVRVMGVSKLVADAAVAQGARVASSADGQGVTAGVNTAFAGMALAAAGAAGEIFPVLLKSGRTAA
jgi:uncharacterized protein DUF2190